MDIQCSRPTIEVDGILAGGTQFDLEITLPEDRRDVIYGVVKDCYRCPVQNAVVKLIEKCDKMGKEELLPVTHTFTNKEGEFVFGPLCPDRKYEIEIWANRVDHEAICLKPCHSFDCLKGKKICCEVQNKCEEKKCRE